MLGTSAASERHSSLLMPKMKTGSCAPQSRAVAAAIPEEPVSKRTSPTLFLFKQMFEAFAVGLIEGFQLVGGVSISDKLMARKHDRLDATRQQRLCSCAADHVDDHRAGNRGNRPSTPV